MIPMTLCLTSSCQPRPGIQNKRQQDPGHRRLSYYDPGEEAILTDTEKHRRADTRERWKALELEPSFLQRVAVTPDPRWPGDLRARRPE